ncbi:MAG: hypothetical protein PHY90_13605, partial [Desulfitobacteriaceae bacterium]|nr:hypothetical protein [Desulfitobacteriaceae bacterium]
VSTEPGYAYYVVLPLKGWVFLSWLNALLASLAAYFLYLVHSIRLIGKAKKARRKIVLVLVLKDTADILESLMWDLFRLQSWSNFNFHLVVVDRESRDDTLVILKTFQRKNDFYLISSPSGRCLAMMRRLKGNARIVELSGLDSVRSARKKILVALHGSTRAGGRIA